MPGASRRRRSFGPIVGLGVASAGLAVLGASNPLVSGRSGAATGQSMAAMGTDLTRSPLAMSLALVVLASWGVLLVTRGWFRKGVAALSCLASLAFAVAVWVEAVRLLDRLGTALTEAPGAADASEVGLTGWVWVCGVAAVVMVAASVSAVGLVRSWPEMGARYDAPAPAGDAPPAQQDYVDMWKALDEGRDPTA